jgi:hypothetical protein
MINSPVQKKRKKKKTKKKKKKKNKNKFMCLPSNWNSYFDK